MANHLLADRLNKGEAVPGHGEGTDILAREACRLSCVPRMVCLGLATKTINASSPRAGRGEDAFRLKRYSAATSSAAGSVAGSVDDTSVPSPTTLTLTCALTSRCSLMVTVWSPRDFNGSLRTILLRSTSNPLAASSAAMSAEVTEPNRWPPSPDLRVKLSTTGSSLLNSSSAWIFSEAERRAAADFICSMTALLASVACSASLRGSRKLRPYPSATLTTSPRWPRLATSSFSITSMGNSPMRGVAAVGGLSMMERPQGAMTTPRFSILATDIPAKAKAREGGGDFGSA